MGLLRSSSLINLVPPRWCAAMFILLASPGLAQERSDTKPHADFTLITGGLLKPATGPTVGGGIGVGWGTRYTAALEVTHIQFGNYAIGMTDEARSAYPISRSGAWEISGNFQVSLVSRTAQGRMAPYITAGYGVVSSHFITPQITCCLAPQTPGAIQENESRKATYTLGSGVRIPIRKPFGIRPELKVSLFSPGSSPIFLVGNGDTLLRLTLGFYTQTK